MSAGRALGEWHRALCLCPRDLSLCDGARSNALVRAVTDALSTLEQLCLGEGIQVCCACDCVCARACVRDAWACVDLGVSVGVGVGSDRYDGLTD